MKKECLLIVLLAAGLFLLAPRALADWSVAKRLTWNSGGSEHPDVAVDSNDTIHIVWDDSSPGNEEIYYRNSEDGGTTWSAAKRLTWSSGDSERPAAAIDSNNRIHIVYYDDTPGNREIYYMRSTDAGTTWSAAKRLTWSTGLSHYPAVAVDSGDAVHVAFYDDTPGNSEIYYRKSPDGGATWSALKRLTWTLYASYSPDIAIDSKDVIYLVCEDYSPGYSEVYYRESLGGATWSTLKRLTWTAGDSGSPAIAINPEDHIHLVWSDGTPGNDEIYHKKSTDGGTTWSALKRLTWTSSRSYTPAIVTGSGNTIHVSWYDETPGDWEIYYRRSPDGGTNWEATQRLTWTSGISRHCTMAIDSGDAVHLVWDDDISGSREIYYRHSQ